MQAIFKPTLQSLSQAGRIAGGLAWLFFAKLWASVCLQCSFRTFQASSNCSSYWFCDLASGSQGWENVVVDLLMMMMMMTTTTTTTPPLLRLLRLLSSLLQLLRISEPSIFPFSALVQPPALKFISSLDSTIR